MSNPEAIADAFIAHYYTCLDQQNYTGLSSLYVSLLPINITAHHTGIYLHLFIAPSLITYTY